MNDLKIRVDPAVIGHLGTFQVYLWKLTSLYRWSRAKFKSPCNFEESLVFNLSRLVSSRYVFSWYPFYFDFHSARIIFDVSSGFYLWNINNTKADICNK
jgi:hypothetical protein